MPESQQWQFWIDRGGTFTDIVAQRPDRTIVTHKLLSEHPARYADAAIQGIRDLLGVADGQPLPIEQIACVKMGTTVATNALLERKGEPTVLLITKGFRDALRIGYQNRPDIFARQILLPEMLYERVIEIEERYSAQGEELQALVCDEDLRRSLQSAYSDGIRACAIVLLHSYRFPGHELQLGELVRSVGFNQISLSHQVSPTIKLVGRGDTTVVDAYLSPVLQRYVEQVRYGSTRPTGSQLGDTPLLFMQSNGGLTAAQGFQGKDSILSGPAGGLVGAVRTSESAGFHKIIGFDMGGTSTDVSHFAGEYERTLETTVAGVRLRVPQLAIHTVAAGGGSILCFDGESYRVGPESAGANPGPACYGGGGPLTVTDCNVMLGKVRSEFFPALFGASGDRPLDDLVVRQKFQALAQTVPDAPTPEAVAAGFLAVAINKMAAAIKKISTQRGYDLAEYALCCFGGAGGQHACLIAEALGMTEILIHPYAGVLSAYGMGLAEVCAIRQVSVELPLAEKSVQLELCERLQKLEAETRAEAIARGADPDQLQVRAQVYLRYSGTDSSLAVDYGDVEAMAAAFAESYRQRYGFVMTNQELTIEALAVEVRKDGDVPAPPSIALRAGPLQSIDTVAMYGRDGWQDAAVYQRSVLQPGDVIVGPALILESTGTTVLESGWTATIGDYLHLILHQSQVLESKVSLDSKADPVQLEIFHNLFRSIAEEMGIALQNTSYSVNIKERLDFSCAVFDQYGQLVANAPHIPVHLGSMGASVMALIESHGDRFRSGNVYISNNPYHGGTHLPDITAITPVFSEGSRQPVFYLAARGHHADIGGMTPGSMPPESTSIEQEGILFDNWLLVDGGQFRAGELRDYLAQGGARNPDQNLGDLQAQVAANERGKRELLRVIDRYGLDYVQAYMQHIQDLGELAVRRAINQLQDGDFIYQTDEGSQIQVRITILPRRHFVNDGVNRSARIDFTGTSPQQPNNFNAPLAICQAAVLYVFRTLVTDDIPLNAGCLKPLEIIVPEGCMLNPVYPAAVVAGNVETSQAIVNALYGALGNMAAAQGTMNNLIFGNDRYQYYETIAGGAGAGPGFSGADGVQTHMTNSRLTDPEVLELRFPVLVEEFAIRANSGGQGQYRGGHGTIRRLQFLEPMTAGILSSSRLVPPFGMAGGKDGAVGRNILLRRDGTAESLGSRARVEMAVGDRLVIETPGGGGWGSL